MGFFIFLLLMAASGTVIWFVLPAVMDSLKLERQNLRISALTKQTKRDMDNLARQQRKGGW